MSVLPMVDGELRVEGRVEGWSACTHCGNTVHDEDGRVRQCEQCGAQEWTYAVTEVERS
jgi:Zn finger protein HypA/HybF involved in hydrogenase expression